MLSSIIVAAGSGTRLGKVKKQFLELNHVPILLYSVKKMICAGADEIVIVTGQDDIVYVKQLCSQINSVPIIVTKGGQTRQQSVKNGYGACRSGGLIAIHDAARPFVAVQDIQTVVQTAKKTGAAVLGVPVSDTIKQVNRGIITATVNRDTLYAIQTPQVFDKTLYTKALQMAKKEYTDDCQLIESLGHSVSLVVGNHNNIKITTPADVYYAKFLAKEGLV